MATKTNTTVNGRDYFRIRRTIDGKQKSFYGKSKGDAEKKYRAYVEEQAQIRSTRLKIALSASFGERAEEFITNVLSVSQKYAKGTAYRYERSYLAHIKGTELDMMQASDVRPSDVQAFYNSLEVSMQTIKGINKFMSAFCKWLQRNEYSDDFMSAVEIPKKPDNKRHDGIVIWEDDEIRRIFENIQGHRLCFFVYVLFYTGVRISEALALKYSDFDGNVLHVSRQYYMKEMKAPKYNSARDIPIHEELACGLLIHKEWHEKEMKKKKYKTDFVFTTSSGNLYDPVNIRRALKRFYAKYGIEHKHVHAYRATFCTQLCRCGVPLEVASALMGHKSLEVTAAHYTMIRQESKEDAMAKLDYHCDS